MERDNSKVLSDKMLTKDEIDRIRVQDGEVTSVITNSTLDGGDQHILAARGELISQTE